jgi:hypothetical protein
MQQNSSKGAKSNVQKASSDVCSVEELSALKAIRLKRKRPGGYPGLFCLG